MINNIPDDYPNLHCKDCKFYKCNAECDNVISECKRADHKHIKFYHPWFVSYNCGEVHHICNDFEPKHPDWNYMKEYKGIDDYLNKFPIKESDITWFWIDGNTEIEYGVPTMAFWDGSMMKDGELNATKMRYYKKSKIEHGVQLYKLVVKDVFRV